MQAHIKKPRIYEVLLLLVCVAAAFELIYLPSIGVVKTLNVFPAVSILGFSATISEILVYSFICIGALYVMERLKRTGELVLAPRRYSIIPLVLAVLMMVSILFGIVVMRNPGALQEVRVMMLPVLFYIIYMNMDIPLEWDKRIYRTLVVCIACLAVVSFVRLFDSDFLIGVNTGPIAKFGDWHSLLMMIFIFDVAAAKVMLKKCSPVWLAITILSFVAIIMRIHHKCAIFGLLISCIVLSYFKVRDDRYGLVKILLVFLAIVVTIYNAFMFLPTADKDKVADIVATRYLKMTTNIKADELNEDLLMRAQENDISAARFDMWKHFLKESLAGFGMAPNGYGHVTEIRYDRFFTQRMKRTHNIIVYYAYQGGLAVAALLVILIFLYIYSNQSVLVKVSPGSYGCFEREELIGVFAFTVSILAVSMVSLSITNLNLAWMLWFCVALMAKRWNILQSAVPSKTR